VLYASGVQHCAHLKAVMALHWIWWIAAALAIAAELLTGTFYLVAIGIAIAAGGVAAWAGFALEMQFLIAGALGVVLTLAAHHWRLRRIQAPPQQGLDIGQAVSVREWRADGTARVAYRGTLWDAELARADIARDAPLYIVDTRGSVLVVSDRRPV
jgi:membrane protein implicated in regulation of membrane protease activity